ncbi:CBS domain-containing protein [Streptomyces mobaraensis]|uniref:CBS domain-containing protein n=1 Tax=Streptomyces mobaraensis TaxID=35621 RepID=UPI003F4D3AC0
MVDHRTVGDLMTHHVVRVRPDTPYKAIVRKLTEYEITAVPVVDGGGRVVGMVSQADLMPKAAGLSAAPARPRPGPPGGRPVPETGAKAEGVRAADLMTSRPVCARPDWTVAEAALVMTERNLGRLPVVDEAEVLVGIVSRGDILRVYLRDDAAIRSEIELDVLWRCLGLSPSAVRVRVSQGQVTLTGTVEADDAGVLPVIGRLCRSVDGVVSVQRRVSCLRTGTESTAASGTR